MKVGRAPGARPGRGVLILQSAPRSDGMAADSVSKISGSGFKIQMGWGAEGKDRIRIISKFPATGKVKDSILS